MADVFDDRLKSSFKGLKQPIRRKMDVPEDRKFIGFDGYKKAMDCLKPGDVAILATPPAFRWVHFTYAIEKGLNVFMEKPVTVDGPTTRRMIELAPRRDRKNLKVGVGLMFRHCKAGASFTTAFRRARSAISSRCGPIACGASAATPDRKPDGSERTAVPDPAIPQLPLGQRRVFTATFTSTRSTSAAG